MSHVDDRLARDIGLWLSGESVGDAADRAITAITTRPEARRATGEALAVEDLVATGTVACRCHRCRRTSSRGAGVGRSCRHG